MNIAITGPQKYDFQDLVCVDIMLRHLGETNAQFLVEPDGGEDGQLSIDGKVFEVQVKGSATQFGLSELAEFLAHFPSKRSDQTLLERIMSDAGRLAVFVISGRCDDAASSMVAPKFPSLPIRSKAIKESIAKEFIEKFASYVASFPTESPQEKRRGSHLRNLVTGLDTGTIRAVLRRVHILERVDESALTGQVARFLVEAYRVPYDRIGDAIARCREVVKSHKGTGGDATTALRSTVESFAHLTIKPAGYVDRGVEAVWVERLMQSGALLVTGLPRSGKTHSARATASMFQERGYEVASFADVEDAERFLDDPGVSPRLAFLDDPLGSASPEPDAVRRLNRLDKLVRRLRPDRKLVVAQSVAQLVATASVFEISNILTGGHSWILLSEGERAFLSGVWHEVVVAEGVPDELAALVENAIGDGTLLLGPGSLAHLGSNHSRLSPPYTVHSAEALARQDSAEIASAWAAEGLRPLLRALAVGSSNVEDLALPELGFVLGSGGSNLPSKPRPLSGTIRFGESQEEPSPHPTYESKPKLSPKEGEMLDLLEQRNLVTWTGDRVNFTHPTYRAAAQIATGGQTRLQADAIIEAFTRAIFSADAKTARAAARNIDWLYDRLQGRSTQAPLIARVLEALESSFPSVRDVCFQFLVRNISRLDPHIQELLPTWVEQVRRYDIVTLDWHDGEALIPPVRAYGADSFRLEMIGLSSDEVASERAILESDAEGYLTAEGATRALFFYRHHPEQFSLLAMGRLLGYSEGFIRAEAAFLWLSVDRRDDEEVLDRLARDDHPRVAARALTGAVRGWTHIAPQRQDRIASILGTFAEVPACAAAMLPNLVKFNRVEYGGENPPWRLLGTIMPAALRSLPNGAHVSETRLFSTLKEAVPKLTPAELLPICDAWTDWLERELKFGMFRDEYASSVADILVRGTKLFPESRGARISRILSLPGTSVSISVLRDLMSLWDLLRPDEKAMVANLMNADRADIWWIRAAALTAANLPESLVSAALPDGPSIYGTAGSLISDLPPRLLEACVYTYTGWVGRLWNFGHGGTEVWGPVIKQLASNINHPLFSAAWYELSSEGEGAKVACVIRAIGANNADRILALLIEHKISRTGDFMPEAWRALLDFAESREVRDSWLGRTMPYLPAILEDLEDIDYWLSESEDRTVIRKSLSADTDALMIANSLSKDPDAQTYVILRHVLERNPPAIHGTYTRLEYLVKAFKLQNEDFLAWLNQLRLNVLDVEREIRDRLETLRPEPVDWIYP